MARVLLYMTASLRPKGTAKENPMLWAIVIVLLLLWGVGVFSAHAFGGLIHLLLLAAVVAIVVNVLQGRKSMV
jgi:hypothetical protein